MFTRIAVVVIGLSVVACGSKTSNPAAPTAAAASPPKVVQVSRTVTGVVREVNGGPISGVAVSVRTESGAVVGLPAMTGSDGSFRLEQVTNSMLWITKPGYVSNIWPLPSNAGAESMVTIKMQPELSVTVGSRISSVLTSDDLTYSSDANNAFWNGSFACADCKSLSIAFPRTADLTLRLSWTGAAPLSLWAGDIYEAPAIVATGDPGSSELVAQTTNGTQFTTVLVGFDAARAGPPPSPGVVNFTLALEGQSSASLLAVSPFTLDLFRREGSSVSSTSSNRRMWPVVP